MPQTLNIEQKLADLIDTRDFETEMLDARGQPADASEAKIFKFDYVGSSGKNYGTMVVVLGNDNEMFVMYGDNLGKTIEDPGDREEFFQFQQQLSDLANRNRWISTKMNITKLKRVAAGIAAIKEGLFEGYYGTRKISYAGEPTQARLMIKHNRPLGENDARYRYVESIFIESADGERFKLPFTYMTGAKAMLEHVRQGGKPYDIRGTHICEMVTELKLLSRFNRATAHRVTEGVSQQLVEQAQDYYQTLKENLHRLSSSRGYSTYFESWHPLDSGQEEKLVEDIKTLFVEQTIDTRIEEALPLLAKIQKGSKMKEADIFESWADRLMEGTWALPETPEQLDRLKQLMSQELVVGPDAINATEQLSDLVGDDVLFDRLADLAQQSQGRANVWDDSEVMSRLQELGIDTSAIANTGDENTDQMPPEDNVEAPTPDLVQQSVTEGLDPEKRARLDDLIDMYRDSTDPEDYYDSEYEDPEEVLDMIRAEFGDKIAGQVEAGTDKMHFPRKNHQHGYDPLGWKKPVDRQTKAGKMYKQDSDYRKNTIKSRYALSGRSATTEASWHTEPEQEIIDATRRARQQREREPAGSERIDAIIRQRNAQRQEYEQTGKFWLKQKDTQEHISDEFIGKAAANRAALELLKQRPELKGNLVITAYGPGETQGVTEGSDIAYHQTSGTKAGYTISSRKLSNKPQASKSDVTLQSGSMHHSGKSYNFPKGTLFTQLPGGIFAKHPSVPETHPGYGHLIRRSEDNIHAIHNALNGQQGVAEGYDQVGFLKQIVADIYPRGGDKETYFQIAKKQVPSDYANSPEFKRDFSKAYDDFFGIEDREDDFDYTDYSMRKGERGVAEGSTDDPQFQKMITNIQNSTPVVDKPSKILRLIERYRPEWFDKYGLGEVEDVVVDMFDMGRFQNMTASDAVKSVGQKLESIYGQQGVAEGFDRMLQLAGIVSEARIIDESGETLEHILDRFKHEVQQFEEDGELDKDLYDALFDYYANTGEMPYGTMKARTGDPYEWVSRQLDKDLGIAEADAMQTFEGDTEDAIAAFLNRGGSIQQGRYHRPRKSEKTDYGSRHIGTLGGAGKPSKMSGTAANVGKVGKPVVAVEGSSCNHTMEGEYCPEHGLMECGSYMESMGGTVAGSVAPFMGEKQDMAENNDDPINYNAAIIGSYYESADPLARIKELALRK